MKHEFNQDRENWLLALESDQYKQGIGALKETFANETFANDPLYCCLGVMCELAGVDFVELGDRAYGLMGWRSKGGGVNTANPPAWLSEQLGFTGGDISTFVGFNDSYHRTFNEIAAIVRFADEKRISLITAHNRLAKRNGWLLMSVD